MDQNEQRELRRCYLAAILEVYDDERDELIGHLDDQTLGLVLGLVKVFEFARRSEKCLETLH